MVGMMAERAEHLTDAADELPSGYARAYRLRAQGHSYREIAATLGVSLGTAHAWTKTAEQALEFASGTEEAERQRDAAALDEWLSRLDAAYRTGESDIVQLSRAAATLLRERRA